MDLLGRPQSRAFTRDAFVAFAVNAAGAATVVGAQMLLARWLGEQEYGLFTYAFAWLALFTLLAGAGLDNTSLRFIGAYAGTQEFSRLSCYLRFAQNRTARFALLLAAAAGLLLLALSRALSGPQLAVLLLGCALLPLNALVQLYGAFIQGFKRVAWSYALQGVVRPLLILGALALWFSWNSGRPKAVSVMLANLAVALAMVLVMRALWHKLLPERAHPDTAPGVRPSSGAAISASGAVPGISTRPASSSLAAPEDGRTPGAVSGCDPQPAEWAKVSHSMFAMSASQFLLSQSDILLVGMLLGTTEAGIYAVASRVAGLVTFGIVSINSVLAPRIADLHARQCRQELQETVTLSSWCVVAYTLPVMLALALGGKLLLGLFGPAFVQGYTVALLLAVGQFVVAMAGSVGFLLTMTGHQKDAATVVASTSGLAVLLVAALTPLLGLTGAALGTMLATCARSSILCYLVKKRLNVSTFAFRTWRNPLPPLPTVPHATPTP